MSNKSSKDTSSKAPTTAPIGKDDDIWNDDDDDYWQEMEVVKEEVSVYGLDGDPRDKRYQYGSPTTASSPTLIRGTSASSHTGHARTKSSSTDEHDPVKKKQEENKVHELEYTKLRLDEEDDTEEIHLRTRFLFDEDKAMTPLSQMQATKNLLTEAQRIAYVSVCYLTCREMAVSWRKVGRKELIPAVKDLELWSMKILGRLYYHMEIAVPEQKMIESLAMHGVTAMDLVPTLMTTHTVANPEYDPVEAQRVKDEKEIEEAREREERGDEDDEDEPQTPHATSTPNPRLNDMSEPSSRQVKDEVRFQTTANVMQPSKSVEVPGVSTHLSSIDKDVTLDIRWTILCDLFLILIADSVYDARSRVMLENVASKLGLGWSEVIRFEKRVTEALEIEEGEDSLDSREAIENRIKAGKRRRYMMMGLATIGGGLVIGLSAGLVAPLIGLGLAGALGTVGISAGATALTSAGGVAVITTTGVLTGSGIAVRGMARRTQYVRTFELMPLHNNKRVNCILTVPGFMNSIDDDVRLPFSVLDSIVGDVFSVRWEPEMMEETGDALSILSTEALSGATTTILSYTILTGLMAGLQWPLLLTKLGYLIDNPWSNALDRAKSAGAVLADVLMQRTLGVRPITLIGFSLGARMIFYCLQELAKRKAYGIVQDVFLLGATVTAPARVWVECRGVVAGRFVNAFARNDWILGYLFRATSGGLGTVAGLRPVDFVPGLENVDITDKIAGHLSYRTYIPLILDQLGFPVTADYFDEPEETMTVDREVVRPESATAAAAAAAAAATKKKRFTFFGKKEEEAPKPKVSRPPSSLPTVGRKSTSSKSEKEDDDDLPERLPDAHGKKQDFSRSGTPDIDPADAKSKIPARAGFDLNALAAAVAKERELAGEDELKAAVPIAHVAPEAKTPTAPTTKLQPPIARTESAPPLTTTASGRDQPPSPSTPIAPYRNNYFSQSNPDVVQEDDLSKRFNETKFLSEEANGIGRSVPSASPTSYSSFSSPYGQSNFAVKSREDSADGTVLSFGSIDGSVWTPNTANTTSTFDAKLSTPNDPFSNSYAVSDIGGFGSTSTPAKDIYSQPAYGSGMATSNPFASSTLSFGSTDGKISTGTTASERDPWAPKPIAGGTKKPAWAINPWDT
ncbi:DUF726-domain-containing protein [Serendipita vermifera]|nr:DUF726-domain-containing protein [Serendipita vermifera]